MISLDGASFSGRRNRGMIFMNRGMVYAKFFYGGWYCFPEGWHPPSN